MLDPLRLQLYGLLLIGILASHGYVAWKAYAAGYKSAITHNVRATEELNERIKRAQAELATQREILGRLRQDRLNDALAADQGEACAYDEAYRRRLNGLVQ